MTTTVMGGGGGGGVWTWNLNFRPLYSRPRAEISNLTNWDLPTPLPARNIFCTYLRAEAQLLLLKFLRNIFVEKIFTKLIRNEKIPDIRT